MNNNHHPHRESPHKGHGDINLGKFTILKLSKNNYSTPSPSPVMRLPMNSFFFLTQGEVFLEIDGESILLRGGEMVLIPASVAVKIHYYDRTVGYMGGFSSDYITDVSQSVVERFEFLRSFSVARFLFEGDKLERVDGIFTTLEGLWSSHSGADDLMRSYLLTLLYELDQERDKMILPTVYNRLAYSFLKALFDENLSVRKPSDFASQLCVSVNHLNKVVRQTTKKSLSEWIEERLMLNAKVLLRNTDTSISDIAYQLGIADPSYFTRRFRQHEGISPKEYREQLK
ncbi:MAG: helix-turn-helix domain-containing protein [Rikenellaceae bacterium]